MCSNTSLAALIRLAGKDNNEFCRHECRALKNRLVDARRSLGLTFRHTRPAVAQLALGHQEVLGPSQTFITTAVNRCLVKGATLRGRYAHRIAGDFIQVAHTFLREWRGADQEKG